MKFDVVIIGSGLGGLLCSYILSKEGYKVCILEKNHKTGGSLQTFGRKACIFNTGLNYTESLDDGQILHQYFRYFGLADRTRMRRLDENGFDVISFPDGKYPLAMGHENFIETLSGYFPSQRENLKRYVQKIKSICSEIPFYNLSDKPFNVYECKSLGIGAADYIRSEISDMRLQNVIAGNNLMYSGHSKKTPLLVHALINNSFIESAWRMVDGSHHLVNKLEQNIVAQGGVVFRNANAVRFITENGSIRSVVLENGEQIEGEKFISNIHPGKLLSMIVDMKISSAFASRINTLEDTSGIFTLYLVFKKDTFPYLNHNVYHYNQENTWVTNDYDPARWPQMYVLMPTASSRNVQYAESASVLTNMKYGELEQWHNTCTGKRGDSYNEFKLKKSQALLNAVEKQYPGITSCVEAFYSSTPLTWRDYTGTRGGSAYGLQKDYNKPMESIILPRTKIPNLYLTGQNTNVHGILGVTIGAVSTCGELVNTSYLINKIKNA